ncbi:unnamed protein product [Rangifer tarandus platyrhynchus]|uniref:Uncharacterized protein n=2 Tax=Rangifer tarandus platyrhynchus TaxID=3082113 RepID=A0ACB0F5W6_RANTA|nr:unnamed protein product [Rangifer tarandus platyrhynchus]CAI9708445.1 unnamed protein product [Rangifer tarandus platyrhynchus]
MERLQGTQEARGRLTQEDPPPSAPKRILSQVSTSLMLLELWRPRSWPVRERSVQSKALPLLHSRPGSRLIVSHTHCPAVAEASSGLSTLKDGRSALPAQGPQCLSLRLLEVQRPWDGGPVRASHKTSGPHVKPRQSTGRDRTRLRGRFCSEAPGITLASSLPGVELCAVAPSVLRRPGGAGAPASRGEPGARTRHAPRSPHEWRRSCRSSETGASDRKAFAGPEETEKFGGTREGAGASTGPTVLRGHNRIRGRSLAPPRTETGSVVPGR